MSSGYELIMCIVNDGFSDTVMDCARKAGARGGTIINAHGSAKPEAEKLSGITIQPEKEVVMIVAKLSDSDNILKAIYDNAGLMTDAHGIAYTLPIDNFVLPEKQKK